MKKIALLSAVLIAICIKCGAQNRPTASNYMSYPNTAVTAFKNLNLTFLTKTTLDSSYIKSKFYNKSAFILTQRDADSLFRLKITSKKST